MMSGKPDADFGVQISPRSFNSLQSNGTANMNLLDPEKGGEVSMTSPTDYSFFSTKLFKVAFLAMCLNVSIFALDQFIITVAVPQIVSEFDALDKVEWLNTAFFIPCAGFVLGYSQIMTVVSPKWTYVFAVAVFEAGSAICGAAHSMNMLIVGRAVAGLGGAGMFNATYLIGSELIPFEKRVTLFALFGLSYMFSSVCGPLIGGALTDTGSSGWRWCFYLNLPFGGITLALLVFALPAIPLLRVHGRAQPKRPMWRKLLRIDWVGTLLTIGFVTCLGIGLQWGGITKAWNDADVIIILVLAGVSLIALAAWSVILGERAMVPVSLVRRSHTLAGLGVSFFGFGIVVCMLYYLSIYFEAIKDKTAVGAGVLLLGLQLSMCPTLVVIGKLSEESGQAKVFIIAGACLSTVASGLLTLIGPSSSVGQLVGFQIIAGLGLGMILNIMIVLTQAEYMSEDHLIPHVTAVVNFAGFLGRIIGMSVATNVFENKLHQGLIKIGGLSDSILAEIEGSPEALWTVVPPAAREAVLYTYSSALNNVWWLTLAFSIACVICAGLMRNLNIKALGEQAAQARNEAMTSFQLRSSAMSAQPDLTKNNSPNADEL